MSDLEEDGSSRYDNIDLDSILSRVERRGPLMFTKKRCLYRAPEFVKRLCGEETVNEGSTVSFTCKVVAFPKPSLTLFKDGEQITDHSRINIEPGEAGEYSLVIRKVTKKDEASYRCKAENDEAKSRSSKKSSSRATAHKRSMFPPITEKVAEEEAEAEETKRSPESPLTHLYYGLTWKNREWPEFLGSWAFVNGMNSKDFDGISDSFDDCSDEDDVFLSDDSLNDADTDFDTETDTTSQPESDVYYGNDPHYNNDLPESLNGGIMIPNLVFENKNLVRSKGHADLSCFTTTRPLTFTKDENANKKILPNDDSHMCNRICTETPPDHSIDSSFKSEQETNSTTGGNSCDKTSELGIASHLERIDWSDICLMLSGSTSLALFTDVAPHVFVFSIIIAQLLYILIRFLLKQE
ncbi:uncharacterized protein LOC117316731 isoform X2 [Pecten maximus]|uniref:uncharacterized protein LOC117316731 isoform X2 n=1 Tax=Pecten maximus TaxID=6579 RepID=UPI001458EE8B|nr:uncharacterized protein LOC117316731 isoform X2 [Pecten maximus]